MKKRIGKKLSINKETVSNLNNREMSNVKGGYATATCPGWGVCDSEEALCTTGCLLTRFCIYTEYCDATYKCQA